MDCKCKFDYKGMMAPVFTPLNDDGSLNLSIIPRYAQLLNGGGVTGVFITGTLGEGMSLTTEERKQVTEAWAKCQTMAGKLVVQVGGTTLKDTQELARHAVSLGVSAIACLPPLYYKPADIHGLVDYLKEVASVVPDTPVLYYHIPHMTNVEFPMDKFLELAAAEIPNLSGIKYTSMEVETEGLGCLKAAGGSLTILNGFDQMLSKSRRIGFHGAIGGCLNFMPLEAGRLMCLAGLADDETSCCLVPRTQRLEEIYKLQDRINNVWEIILKHCNGSFVSGSKMVMNILTRIDVGPARKPQQKLSDSDVTALKADLQEHGFVIPKNS